MADEPAAPIPVDALDLESLSDEELQRLIQLLMSERERRLGLEPGPEEPLLFRMRSLLMTGSVPRRLGAATVGAGAPRPAMSGW
jgi:hypothetical protein